MLNVSELIGFGAGEGAGFTHWRLLLSGADESGGYQLCSDLEMRATPGGADQCSGGVASASNSQSGNPASNAFDADTATMWSSGAYGAGEWLAYTFAAPVLVYELSYRSNVLVNSRGPTQIELQHSPDGGATWTTFKTWAGLVGWTTAPRVLTV